MRDDRLVIAMIAAGAALSGCAGSEDDYANNPRPPAPINVTAAVTDKRVTVSPEKFGAGPVVIIIANQTEVAQKVTLETDEIGGSSPGVKQTTSPINPSGTATLKVDLREGTYEVRTEGAGIRPAELTVGAERESAQNQLLQP
jgi:hypothetical protein